MGSTTMFQGQFVISPPLSNEEVEEINLFCDNPKGEDLPGVNCDWIFATSYEDDEMVTTMEWNGMEKSYFMPEWACFLANKFFMTHEVSGRIRARGEEFDDIWTMIADPMDHTITREEGWND
ncbi:MAG: hypothetical protein ACW987_20005 [Candidatus Thorarchaeota archaeon]|jgi:hypothetical protein